MFEFWMFETLLCLYLGLFDSCQGEEPSTSTARQTDKIPQQSTPTSSSAHARKRTKPILEEFPENEVLAKVAKSLEIVQRNYMQENDDDTWAKYVVTLVK